MQTALIALDYIVDIMHPDGKIARAAHQAESRGIVGVVNGALDLARSREWLVVLVKVGFSANYAGQPKRSPMFGRAHELRALDLGGSGTDFHPDLHVHATDLVLVKPRVSAFYGTGLEAALRARSVERVVLAGVSSDWAVEATARDAHDRDYEVIVIEDACAAATEEDHRAAMKLLTRIATIIPARELAALS